MSIGLSAIGSSIVKQVFPLLAKALVAKINSELNPTDVEKALKSGLVAADEWDKAQAEWGKPKPLEKQMFSGCEPRLVEPFLKRFFNDSGVQQELQKPLKNEGTPSLTYLIEAFKKAASEPQAVIFNESSLPSWLKAFTDAYFTKTSTYLKFQIAKENYFQELADRFDDVKFAGIAVEGQESEKSANLAQIFVMPDVAQELQSRDIISWELNSNLEKIAGNRQADLLWEQRKLARLEEQAGKKFPAQQLLNEGLIVETGNFTSLYKFVLLGAPGSGKTTLMSYFAVIVARKQPQELGLAADIDWLPILIRIRDLARYPDLSILEYVQQFACKSLCVKNLPPGFFEYWLEDGRALILLDGLDEVTDSAKRYEVVSRIESFLGQYSQNRAIITSRPAGYKRDFFRTEEFPHYKLQLFDDSQIELFVKQWYYSRFKDQEEAKRRQESLQKALAEQDRIKLLAKNPLLLTIISLIHRYEADLPRQRHKLYDRAVKTLLTNWDKGKDIGDSWPLEYLKRDDIERLMQQLAYWIHTQGGTGDKEGGTLIDKDELMTQLSKYIAEQKSIEPYQAKAEAKRFVEHIRERTGLLNEQGQDCYAFVHKTFQEYLAAEDIRDRQEGDGLEVVLEHIHQYLHDAHWREVLLLLIAQQHRKKSPNVLKEILRQPTPYEQWLHRNLLFAGRCLAEDLEVSDDNLVADILQQLVALEMIDVNRASYRISSQVFQTFCSLYETRFEAQALQVLRDSANGMDKVRLQEYRAALGEKEEAIKALLPLLADQNDSVRSRAADALGMLGKASQEVLTALLPLLADQNFSVRFHAAYALGMLGKASQEVLTALLPLLADQNDSVRSAAAFALGQLGKASQEVLTALLPLLADKDNWVRSGAASALGNLGNASQEVLTALLPLLADKDNWVRSPAALALGKLGKNSNNVAPPVAQWIEQHQDAEHLGNAIDVLWGLVAEGNSV